MASTARGRRAGNIQLSPEYRVLLAAARPGSAAPDPELWWSGVRWDVVAQLAGWHRLGPMLYRLLSGQDAVPHEIVEGLQREYVGNAARNLYLRAQARVLLDALADAGIRAMPLKGLALVEDVYADAGLRPMRDIDILVPPSDIERAERVVTGLGYRAVAALHGKEADGAWMAEHHHHAPALIDPDGIFAVELHRHLVGPDDPAYFDISALWDRSSPAGGGRRHLVSTPEDLLVHVAVHFCRSRLWRSDGSLGQIADIAWILDRRDLDWDALVGRASADGVAASLFLALFAARELLGAAVPTSVMATLEPPAFGPNHGRRFLEDRVLRRHLWLSLEFLTPGGRPLFPVVPDRGYMSVRYGETRSLGLARQHLRRVARAVRLFGPSLARPWQRVGDLRLNRWLRSLDRRS